MTTERVALSRRRRSATEHEVFTMWPFSIVPPARVLQRVANTIGAGSIVRGDVHGTGGLRVDGQVEGDVHADDIVIIGERGLVEGTIVAPQVRVLGRVRGNIHASGHLEIGPEGKVVGDITVGSFRIHKGGLFRGMSRMAGAEDLSVGALSFVAPPPALAAPQHSGRTLPPPGDGAVPPPARMRELPPPSGPVAVAKLNDSRVNPRRTLPLVDELDEVDRAAG